MVGTHVEQNVEGMLHVKAQCRRFPLRLEAPSCMDNLFPYTPH